VLNALLTSVGRALRPIRPGLASLAGARLGAGASIMVGSPSFNGRMTARLTADGEGVSPALDWSAVPAQTRSVVLLVQDADIPAPRPLTHLILYGISPALNHLAEGEMRLRLRGPSPRGYRYGRNGFGRTGWLPPSPLPGHGAHRYAFQVFALDTEIRFSIPPGRTTLIRAMADHVVGFGQVIGTYERP